MKYDYVFHFPDKMWGTAPTISTDTPLPHIQVGNSVQLQTEIPFEKRGFPLVVSHIGVVLPPLATTDAHVRVDVHLEVWSQG